MEPTLKDWTELFEKVERVTTRLEATQLDLNTNSNRLLSTVSEVREIAADFKSHKTYHTAIRWCMGSIFVVLGGIASQVKWAVLF